MQCVAVRTPAHEDLTVRQEVMCCCSALQCVAVCCSTHTSAKRSHCQVRSNVLSQCVAVCGSTHTSARRSHCQIRSSVLLQCVAVCCSTHTSARRSRCHVRSSVLLQCVAVRKPAQADLTVRYHMMCCCSVSLCVAVYCSVLQYAYQRTKISLM